jgi:hypothetical protein
MAKPHKLRVSTKWKAIEVASFVLGLEVQKQAIKEGKASYRQPVPADADVWERYAHTMRPALRKRGIIRQTAEHFGKSEKQIQRYLRLVERNGWGREVIADWERERWEGEPARKQGKIAFWHRSIGGRPSIAAVRRKPKRVGGSRAS